MPAARAGPCCDSCEQHGVATQVIGTAARSSEGCLQTANGAVDAPLSVGRRGTHARRSKERSGLRGRRAARSDERRQRSARTNANALSCAYRSGTFRRRYPHMRQRTCGGGSANPTYRDRALTPVVWTKNRRQSSASLVSPASKCASPPRQLPGPPCQRYRRLPLLRRRA
jgi:hypothetical protein